MDNFFNTVDNAFSEANTPEARSERNTRRSKIIEDKLADSPNDEKLKKKKSRLAAERVGIDIKSYENIYTWLCQLEKRPAFQEST